MNEERDGLVALDEQELESVNGGEDSGIAWGLGYSIGWAVSKVETAIWYYRTQF